MPLRSLALAVASAGAILSGPGTAAASDSRTDLMVQALKRSPVFVSDLVPRRVGPAEAATLVREVEQMPFPTFLVVAPLLSGEPDGERDEDRLALLRDGVGRDGLYIVSDDRGTTIELAAYGVQSALPARDVERAANDDLDRNEPTLKKLRYTLAVARGEPRLPRSQRAFVPESEGGPVPTPYREEDEDGGSSSGVVLGALAVFLFGAAGSATTLERRRRRRQIRGTRRPGSVPAGDVRQRALAAHQRLADAIAGRGSAPERAFDLVAAASMALDRDGSPIDDLGALVLAQRGREALAGKEKERCFFDPRHTGRIESTRWQAERATIEVPACPRCLKAVAAGKVPDALFDGDRPYWQRDTVWARTGFGALRRDMRRALAEDRG